MADILLVDDEPAVLNLLFSILKKQEYNTTSAMGGAKALELLQRQDFNLMICDLKMEAMNGLEVLQKAKEMYPNMAVIILTAHGSVESAVDAMKKGAYDYITKPFKIDELLMTVKRALEYQGLITENITLKEQLSAHLSGGNMVAESPAMRKLLDMVRRVAPTDQTVLISGESGVGKEVVAKAIHEYSVRKNENFVPINCAALPENLLESELFGHVKGAFTGASSDKIGLFEEADGGTILLDEIGSMPLNLQGKLLRVLQESQVRKVGGNQTITVDVRVLAASNENLEQQIAEGKFREDLYYRLSVIPLHIAPLRERKEDILPLAFYVLKKIYGRVQEMPEVSSEVQQALEEYNWPGNVRELENAIRHAATFCHNKVIRLEDLPPKVTKDLVIPEEPSAPFVQKRVIRESFDGTPLKTYIRRLEETYINSALESFEGDKELAAKALKVSLATLYRKLPHDQLDE